MVEWIGWDTDIAIWRTHGLIPREQRVCIIDGRLIGRIQGALMARYTYYYLLVYKTF